MKKLQIPTIDIRRYGGQQVAIVDGKIIATGATLGAVIAKARKQVPKRPLHEIKVISVPRSLAVIYHVE